MTNAVADAGGGLALTSDELELTELARRHAVCYEVWPEHSLVAGEKVQIGFQLELLGVNARHSSEEAPGCRICEETYLDLRRIAEWSLPEPGRPTRYEIAPFDAAWHQAAVRGFRREVVLRVQLVHSHEPRDPVNDCQRRCLAEIEEKLARLGIGQGRC